jgi:hypothetical protein
VKYSRQQLDQEVKKQVEVRLAQLNKPPTSPQAKDASTTNRPTDNGGRNLLAVNRIPLKTPRPRGLSRQEREQLAADLRLIPRNDDELPFILSDEPNQ